MTTADLVRFYAALALIALTIPALLWACRKDPQVTRPLGRVESWAFHRWIVRRFNHERGYDYPRWWRARRARRLSLGLPAHVADPIRADVERPLLIDRLAEMSPRDTTYEIDKDQP